MINIRTSGRPGNDNCEGRDGQGMRIKGVIFDMDGLMIDTEKVYNRCMVRAANELGYPMERGHALMLRSLDVRLAQALMKTYFGETYEHGKVRKLYHQYVDEYFTSHKIEVKPGLFDLLTYLKERRYLTCVATSTERGRANMLLEKIGAKPYFGHFCFGSELAHSNPAPDIYLKAAKEIGLQTKECMALEDSPNGVRSAFAAGCCTVMVPDLTQPDEEINPMIYAKVDSLLDVKKILENPKELEKK